MERQLCSSLYRGGTKTVRPLSPMGNNMIRTVSQIRDELADREAIRDCLFRYARAVDRLDENLLRTAYWPDAIDTHLEFSGNVEEFIAWAFPKMRAMDQTLHIIGNILIRLDGTTAAVEFVLLRDSSRRNRGGHARLYWLRSLS